MYYDTLTNYSNLMFTNYNLMQTKWGTWKMSAVANRMASNTWRMENWMLQQLDIHKSRTWMSYEFEHDPEQNKILAFFPPLY